MSTSSSSSSRALFSRRFLRRTRSTWPHPSPAHRRLHEKPPCNGHAQIRMDKVVRYIDCRKNHAASTGGYIVDGCREFLASGDGETVASLTCAACGCHRSFHRRLVIPDCCSNSASPR